MSVCHSVALFPELNVQEIVLVTTGRVETSDKFKGATKTEVKGCGEAMSRDKLLHSFALQHFLCTKFRT